MIVSIFYFILALLGLGLLIFVHELGHYIMARRVGMRVESFGIGFGKPIFSFERKGVRWNICWIPFGGYVKIAGMEKDGSTDPKDIPDGFFGKSPWDRLQVAIMGPIANLVLSFLLFALLWGLGGQEKNFSEVTRRVGWIDPNSSLFLQGIRPGDEIYSYDARPLTGAKGHIQAAMMAKGTVHVVGKHLDQKTGIYEKFAVDIKPYSHPLSLDRDILTTGVLAPASYLIYGDKTPLTKNSPLYGSGIEPFDRIVWVDGEEIYSLPELSHVLNDSRALLTIQRGNKVLLRRVPRILLNELRLDKSQQEELQDWLWEAQLQKKSWDQIYFIPYNLSSDGYVESTLHFIDEQKNKQYFDGPFLSSKEEPLQVGDHILAVDGVPSKTAFTCLQQLQKKNVYIIVERGRSRNIVEWDKADNLFGQEFSRVDITALEATIGMGDVKEHKSGNLFLLQPIEPCKRSELYEKLQDKDVYEEQLAEERKQIQSIEDPKKRELALQFVQDRENQLLLGLPGVQDIFVLYNPDPFTLFGDIASEVSGTLSALVGGYLNPKWLSGPIGIVQVIHNNWMVGVKSAIFWIATISLNLGLLNLLPLPVLDGGYIFLSLFEIVTRKRLDSKTIEKIVIPFAILLITFFIYLTYNDIMRLFVRFFK